MKKALSLIIVISAALSIFLVGCNKVERGYKEDDVDSSMKMVFVADHTGTKYDGNSYMIDSSMFLCVNGVQKVKLTDQEFSVITSLTGMLGQGSVMENVNTKGLSDNQMYVYQNLPEVFDNLARGDELYSEEASDPDWKIHSYYDFDKDDQVTYREYAMMLANAISKKVNM